MRTLNQVTLIAMLFAGLNVAQAACEYPPTVKVPDGTTATKEEMAAARTTVQKYMAEMQAYVDCLDAEEAALPAEQQTAETKALVTKRHNAAVDAMQGVADQYNEQLRAAKARSK